MTQQGAFGGPGFALQSYLPVVDDYGYVGGGVSQGRYVLAENGSEYIIKGPSLWPKGKYAAANELISAGLGTGLGLPLLDHRILTFNSSLVFASQWMLKPTFYDQTTEELFLRCENGDRSYDIAVFDVWVHNTDRHGGNLLVRLKPEPHAPNGGRHFLMLNDHSHCFHGPENGRAELAKIVDVPASTCVRLPFLLRSLTDPAKLDKAVARIEKVTDGDIDNVVSSVPAALLDPAETCHVIDFLKRRRDQLRSLVNDFKQIPCLGGGTI